MGVWSKLQNKTCQEMIHPWTTSCTLSVLDVLLATWIGATGFHAIHYFFEYLIKRAKLINKGELTKETLKLSKEELKGLAVEFMRGVVLFGSIESCTTIGVSCFLRSILGKYYFLTAVFIPGVIGGLSIFNLEPSRRLFYSSFFANSVLSSFDKRLRDANILKFSLKQKTFIFMTLSACISGIQRRFSQRGPQLKFFWFFDQFANCVEENSHSRSCYHTSDCKNRILTDVGKGAATGFILSMIKVLFKWGPNMMRDPTVLFKRMIEKDTYKLAAFFGLYAGTYQLTRCILHRCQKEKKKNILLHNILAGALAGWTYCLCPSDTIFSTALVTIAQILTRIGCTNGILPNWPYVELVYAVCNGIIFHLAVTNYDKCPTFPRYIVNVATFGRASYYARHIEKLKLS